MNGKQRMNFKTVIASAGIGVLAVLIIATALLMLEGVLILNETIKPSASAFIGVVIHSLSVYVGCLIAGGKAKDAMPIAMTGVLILSMLIQGFLSVLLLDQQVGHFVYVFLPELAGAVLAVLTLSGKGRKGKTVKIKKRYL